MKKQRNSKNVHINIYKDLENKNQIEDTRYWGLFKTRSGIQIDPVRYQKQLRKLSEEQLSIMNNRKTHLFKLERKIITTIIGIIF
ncbi:MAG: hypothetical protein CVV58_00950 [Tenericutes bacterium HGW-Tenericutes-3]|nr:MAG: hypothetical protein CVV58_00950 [Tenericutes bacterium HGW-Tenericutes-3]